jgi:hypothetical protein
LSDTAKDTYGEKMSLQLFQDFITHIEQGDPIPLTFQTDFYKGGMPYVSLAHYPDLNGKAVLGDTTDLYIDGKQLKAKGTFNDTPLGRASFNSVCKSLYDNTEKDKRPVRLSIGFLDMGHAHGDQEFVRNSITDVCPMCQKGFGDKEYRKGYLIHEALTRVPVNPRTEIVAEVNKSMNDIKTRLDDASSIVGEELAQEVEKEASTMVGKSDVLVIKAEEPIVDVKLISEPVAVVEPIVEVEKVEPVQAEVIPLWAAEMSTMLHQLVEKSPNSEVQVANSSVAESSHPLKAQIDELTSTYTKCCSSKEMDKPQKLQSIQEAFSKLGEGIKRGIAELPDYPQPEISTEMKSSVMIAEAVSKAVATQLQPLVDQVSLITQQMGTVQGTKSVVASIPQRRSLDPTLVQQSQQQAPGPKSATPKLHDLIQKTLGQ